MDSQIYNLSNGDRVQITKFSQVTACSLIPYEEPPVPKKRRSKKHEQFTLQTP